MNMIDLDRKKAILKRLDPMWYVKDAVNNYIPLDDISATDVDLENIEADFEKKGMNPPTWNEVDQVLREVVEEILTENGFRWDAKWRQPVQVIWPKVTDDPDVDWETAYPDNTTFLDTEGDKVPEPEAPCDLSPAVWIEEKGKDVWLAYISYATEKEVR